MVLEGGAWRLFLDAQKRRPLSSATTKGVQEDFEYICVAHNGKCAERLMREADVPALHKLLKCKFGSGPPPKALMQLSSLWVCCFAVKGSLGLPFEGAFVKGSQDLCWVADNSKKMAGAGAAAEGYEAWTLVSTRPYGTANKVPQENVPKDVADRVTREMTRAFETAAGLAPGTIAPVASRVQLWGAGVPMNTYTPAPCILDAAKAAGICGDWLVDPSVQGAAISGIEMADAIKAHLDGKKENVGILDSLDGAFRAVDSPACGSFPGLPLKGGLM
ncbi:hypothetical protein T484DRAFT_1775620 [Baffinella frigidus]|nr:hypothetical protein T484DRAFT_1775620 [Cryptophyta sp. CCMP2293]